MGNCGVVLVWKIIKVHKDIFAVQLQAGNKIDNSRMKQPIPEQLGEEIGALWSLQGVRLKITLR